jgi:ABC-type dipeptide/oligopeptide/nickel transport system permease subunit
MSAADLGPATPESFRPLDSRTGPDTGPGAERGSGRLILAAFARDWQARAGVAVVVLLALFCFVGPLLYRTNQVGVNLSLKDLAPSGSHPLGTDDTGYDVLGRLMLGGQSSLELGFAVASVTTLIGTAYGAIAGLASGIVVSATFGVADAILALSTLSFLGPGLPPPHADWGTMLTSGLNDLFNGYWWLVYPPAVILIITIIAFSLIGDAVRDSLDVRLRRR